MKRDNLDNIDIKILSLLQENGRITNVDLADKVDLSAPPCLRRVRSLEKNGFIKGYHADLQPEKLGFEVTVFAMVGLHNQAEQDLKAFEARVLSLPYVRECHMLNGEIDFILKCVAPDLSTFQIFLTKELTSAPNVASVKTSLTIRQSKQMPGIPIDLMD
ncbi:Lrp/AsnC family transcriptional regulator [Hyphomicrobiales bacterium]|nr:Lrp/AsnC family transcriptional regulator [Hyphomicrobiales bacterium]